MYYFVQRHWMSIYISYLYLLLIRKNGSGWWDTQSITGCTRRRCDLANITYKFYLLRYINCKQILFTWYIKASHCWDILKHHNHNIDLANTVPWSKPQQDNTLSTNMLQLAWYTYKKNKIRQYSSKNWSFTKLQSSPVEEIVEKKCYTALEIMYI